MPSLNNVVLCLRQRYPEVRGIIIILSSWLTLVPPLTSVHPPHDGWSVRSGWVAYFWLCCFTSLPIHSLNIQPEDRSVCVKYTTVGLIRSWFILEDEAKSDVLQSLYRGFTNCSRCLTSWIGTSLIYWGTIVVGRARPKSGRAWWVYDIQPHLVCTVLIDGVRGTNTNFMVQL